MRVWVCASACKRVYIKEVTYHATNIKESGEISAPSTNLGLAFKYIKDMQKEYKEKENEEKEKEGMIKQDEEENLRQRGRRLRANR